MGKTIQVEGETVSVNTTTTVADLKRAAGAAKDDVATYIEDGDIVALGDRDTVHRTVPDGANISFQPGRGTVFG